MLKKTSIRKAIVAYLKADTDVAPFFSTRIFPGRILPYSKDETYPAISVYNRIDSVDGDYTSHTRRSNELNIIVAVKENKSTDLTDLDFDEVVETAQLEVEKAMSKILRFGNLPGDPFELMYEIVYKSSTTAFNSESGDNIGLATIIYDIIYDEQSPIDPGNLPDFDIDGSIDNLIITNEGIPQS